MKQLSTQSHKITLRNSERLDHLFKLLPTTLSNQYYHHNFPNKIFIDTILDIGCGNAEITAQMASSLDFNHVYAADIYPYEIFQQPINSIFIKYYQVINSKIMVPDHSISLITCFMSLHHFDNFDLMLQEICRIIRINGLLFLREHDVNTHQLTKYLDQIHFKYPDHNGLPINYWERQNLKKILTSKFGFKHLSDSDYPHHINNKQNIYHSLYIYTGPHS